MSKGSPFVEEQVELEQQKQVPGQIHVSPLENGALPSSTRRCADHDGGFVL